MRVYVLGLERIFQRADKRIKWNQQEQKELLERVEVAAEAVKSFATIGLGLAMTQWNNK